MIEFLDPDSSTHLGSALWNKICTERRLCVILKAILCPWKSRWVFILVLFWVFCFKHQTLANAVSPESSQEKKSSVGEGSIILNFLMSVLYGIPAITVTLGTSGKDPTATEHLPVDSGHPRRSRKISHPKGPTAQQGQTQWEDRACSSSFLWQGIRSQGAAWNGEVVLIPEPLG